MSTWYVRHFMELERVACIGLDPQYVDVARDCLAGRALTMVYDVPPRMGSHMGRLFAESPSIAGKMLLTDRVVWYSYFSTPIAADARKAIALSNAPSFPTVRKAILHDTRALSLILATEADPGPKLARGFVSPGIRCPVYES